MRKNSLFFLGAMTGTCLTFLVTGPQGARGSRPPRRPASADTYSQLNLFGEVFERVRTDYVEKPDDAKLVEGAINGMVASLDPHSRYMNDRPGAKCRRPPAASSAALVSRSRWRTAWSRWCRRSTTRPRPRPASCQAT